MKRILIIQLARYGDIFQTLPTVRGLKNKFPESKITVFVRKTFSEAAKLSRDIDEVIEFPTVDILGPYFSSKNKKTYIESKNQLMRWLSTSGLLTNFDLVINLTFSKASSFFCKLIPSEIKLGFTRSLDGELCIRDSWSQYFLSQVLTKNKNILHLNDIFARIARVEARTDLFLNHTETHEGNPANIGENTQYIGVQVGSSKKTKTLESSDWKKICNEIQKKLPDTQFVFFGSNEELDSILEIAPAHSVILAGKTNFSDCIPWIKRCAWIITPDTAIVHLASLLNVKTINYSIGSVRAAETGPYGDGHHVLVPNGNCTPGDFAAATFEIIKNIGGDFKCDRSFLHYVTRLHKNINGSFRNILVPLNFSECEDELFFKSAYYLLSEFRCSGLIEDLPIPTFGISEKRDSVDRILNAYDSLCTLKRIATFGQKLSTDILLHKNNSIALKQITQNLEKLDILVEQLYNANLHIRPLVDWMKTSRDSFDCPKTGTERLEALANALEGAYRELKQNIEIIETLLQTATQESQKQKKKYKRGVASNVDENI